MAAKPSNPRSNPKIGTKIVEGKIVGRNKIVIDPNEVRKLAALSCRDIDIANFYGVNIDTLIYNFGNEIIEGREDVKNRLRQAMLENAIVRNIPSIQIFLAKNMLGMRDIPLETDDTKPLPWNDDF